MTHRTLRQSAKRYPLALALSAAAILLGTGLVVAPELAHRSPSIAVMPVWGVVLWGLFFLLGGAATTFGILTGARNHESAGSTLQGTAYGCAAVSAMFATAGPSPLGVLFLLAIAIGFVARGSVIHQGPK